MALVPRYTSDVPSQDACLLYSAIKLVQSSTPMVWFICSHCNERYKMPKVCDGPIFIYPLCRDCAKKLHGDSK